MTREQKIRRIAAGAPHPIPDALLADALTGSLSIEAFALAVAEHCILSAQIEQRAREISEA